MKFLIGIIKPTKLAEVCVSLSKLNMQNLSITDVKGFGRQKGYIEHYHGSDYKSDFFEKTKIEVTIEEVHLAQAIEIILGSAKSGAIGDGKIFVYEVN